MRRVCWRGQVVGPAGTSLRQAHGLASLPGGSRRWAGGVSSEDSLSASFLQLCQGPSPAVLPGGVSAWRRWGSAPAASRQGEPTPPDQPPQRPAKPQPQGTGAPGLVLAEACPVRASSSSTGPSWFFVRTCHRVNVTVTCLWPCCSFCCCQLVLSCFALHSWLRPLGLSSACAGEADLCALPLPLKLSPVVFPDPSLHTALPRRAREHC